MHELTLMVCPHDTVRNPEGWYGLVQYLTARLDVRIHFELSLDFADFRQAMTEGDLVYANPADALRLLASGFVPLVRPADTYDEALLVAGPDGDVSSIDAINGAPVATVEPLLPTRLALRMLRERGIAPASLLHRDSWLSVVRSVWNGEAPFGILYRDAYDELSPQGRAMVRVIETTSMSAAFHMLCAGPAIAGEAAALAGLLLSMGDDPDGASVLAGLRIAAWAPVRDEELARLRATLA